MRISLLVLITLSAGALLAAQGPIFARSASHTGGPVQAAILAFAVALVALTLFGLLTGESPARPSTLAHMPLWMWGGGLIGMVVVLLTIHAVPRTGAALFVAALVCGQVTAALLYDHFGAFGLQVRRIGTVDLLGVALLMTGLLMIAVRRNG